MECNVIGQCRQNIIYNNLISITTDNSNQNNVPNSNQNTTIFPYSFTINLISNQN